MLLVMTDYMSYLFLEHMVALKKAVFMLIIKK